MELILGRMAGWSSLPEFPYLKPQASGGYLGLALIGLWKGRRHLRQVAVRTFRSDDIARNSSVLPKELQSHYRIAVVSILVGTTTITLFCVKAGMSLGVIGFFSFSISCLFLP